MIDRAVEIIEALKALIAEAEESAPNDILLQKKALLRETSLMISRLEQKDLPVPESYRSEKALLVSDLSRMDGAKKTLDYIADELDDILSRLGYLTAKKADSEGDEDQTVDLSREKRRKHGTRPTSFQVDGSPLVSVNTWKEVLIGSCEFLISKYPDLIPEITRLSKRKKPFFSESAEGFLSPHQLTCRLFIETHRGSKDIIAFIRTMLRCCGKSPSHLRIKTSER